MGQVVQIGPPDGFLKLFKRDQTFFPKFKNNSDTDWSANQRVKNVHYNTAYDSVGFVNKSWK